MKTVLVSGSSGIVGYGVLRSLRACGEPLKLIGTSIYLDSVAPAFCDIFEQALPTASDEYIAWLSSVIQRHGVDLLIPGIESDMYKWLDHRRVLEATGATPLLNNDALIKLCRDKWVFYQKLVEFQSSHAIDTSITADYEFLADAFGVPFLLKPRRGFGSKGIVKVDDSTLFMKYRDDIGPRLMAQPIVGNDLEEYTTSAFCDGSGSFHAHMSLRRKLSSDGFTEKAEVVVMPEIEDAVSTLCGHFNPIGPTNFQFRRHNGRLLLLEINPRISSSTSIRTGFGYNESLMTVQYYLKSQTVRQPTIRRGRAVRYSEDFFFYETGTDL